MVVSFPLVQCQNHARLTQDLNTRPGGFDLSHKQTFGAHGALNRNRTGGESPIHTGLSSGSSHGGLPIGEAGKKSEDAKRHLRMLDLRGQSLTTLIGLDCRLAHQSVHLIEFLAQSGLIGGQLESLPKPGGRPAKLVRQPAIVAQPFS